MLASVGVARTAVADEAAPGATTAQQTLAPKPISDLDVPYPEGATGDISIVLTLTVERDGTVSAVTPEPTIEPFASLAVKAAKKWTFQPALRAGAPVRVRIRMVVDFRQSPTSNPVEQHESSESPEQASSAARVAPRTRAQPVEIQVRGVKVEPSRTASLSRAEVRQIPLAIRSAPSKSCLV